MSHKRIRPFNIRHTYLKQRLDNVRCQAMVPGQTIYLRGQLPQDHDMCEKAEVGDPTGWPEKVSQNIDLLLRKAGASLTHICKVTVYLIDSRYREAVYGTAARWLMGVSPVLTRLVVVALARPEWLVEIDIIAKLP